MSGKVVHFEIPFDDGDRARKFYGEAFGWQTMTMPELNYTMVTTGPSDPEQGPTEPGFINGGMFERSDDFPGKGPNLAIDVPSVDDALRRVEEAGGKVAGPKMPVGDMGFAGYFTDPEGNLLGLWESALTAPPTDTPPCWPSRAVRPVSSPPPHRLSAGRGRRPGACLETPPAVGGLNRLLQLDREVRGCGACRE